MQWCDGEARIVTRAIAKILVRQNAAAREYCDELRELKEALQARHDSSSYVSDDSYAPDNSLSTHMNGARADLWERVARRIDEEQRAAVYLGAREGRERIENEGLRGAWSFPSFGRAGALATACMLGVYLVADPKSPLGRAILSESPLAAAPSDGPRNFASGESAAPTLVSSRPVGGDVLGSAGITVASLDTSGGDDPIMSEGPLGTAGAGGGVHYGLPRILEPDYPVPLEVDWMRSDGRVRLMQDSNARSAIIWIRRNPRRVTSQLSAPDPYGTLNIGR